jgi:hypothetical protein
MKKFIFTIAIVAGISFAASAQTTPSKTKSTAKTETNKTTTTAKHSACGQKGHVCTADCHKAETKSTGTATMKEHTCTSACTANGHMYACGEKGHTCTAECKKMK